MAVSQKESRIPFYKLVATGVDLASIFKSAVDAFNGRDLDTLISLCDNNVVLMEVKHQRPHCGKDAVRAYLDQQFRVSKPTFTPCTTDTTVNPAGTVGHIIGTADWTAHDPDDPDGAHIDGTIRYAFNFVNRNDEWRMSTVWGAPDHLNHRA